MSVKNETLSIERLTAIKKLFGRNVQNNEHLCFTVCKKFSFDDADLIDPIYENERFRKYLSLLHSILKCKTFYNSTYLNNVKNTINFLSRNLTIETLDNDVKKYLLKLLMAVLYGIKHYGHLNIFFDKCLILVPLIVVLKSSIEFKHDVTFILLEYILPVSTDDEIKIFSEILKIFLNENDLESLIRIFNCVISGDNLQVALLAVVFRSILLIAKDMAKKVDNEELILRLFKCINITYFEPQYRKIISTYLAEEWLKCVNTLNEYIGQVCVFYCKYYFDQEVAKILQIIIEYYAANTDIVFFNINISDEIKQLPKYLGDWPLTSNLAFFIICCVMFKTDRILWGSPSLLMSIKKTVYSTTFLNTSLMKMICRIFPILYYENCTKETDFLGKAIFDKIPQQKNSIKPFIIFEKNQLFWILRCGTNLLKQDSLCLWIYEHKEIEDIGEAVREAKAQRDVLKLLLKSQEAEIIERCTKIMEIIEDENLSINIAKKMLSADKNIFQRLVKCNPLPPKDPILVRYLCEHFSINLPALEDEEILTISLQYVVQLLSRYRKSDSVHYFLKNIGTLQYLSKILKEVQESTATEIIALFKFVAYLQIKHKFNSGKITVNLHEIMTGNPRKLNDIILLLLVSINQECVFQFHEDIIIDVFRCLINICTLDGISRKSLLLIQRLIKKFPRLVTFSETAIFIESYCMGCETCQDFNKVIYMYLVQQRDTQTADHMLPELQIVENFIHRSNMSSKTKKSLSNLNRAIHQKKKIVSREPYNLK